MTSVNARPLTLPDAARMSMETFNHFVVMHQLSQGEVGKLIELVETFKVSIPHVGKLLQNGFRMSQINAAYILRQEVGSLYDSDRSRGKMVAEFQLSVEKACQLLAKLYTDGDLADDDDSVEAAVRFLCEVADRCPQIETWSSIVDLIDEIFASLESEMKSRCCDLLDTPPLERVELMIEIVDELQLVVDHRFPK